MKKEGLLIVSLVLVVLCVYPVLSQDVITENDQMGGAPDTSNLQLIVIGGSVFALIVYVYFSLAIMKTSEKLGLSNKWKGLAWLPPVIPYLFSQMAKKKWWPAVVLIVTPFIMSMISSIIMVNSIQSSLLSVIGGSSGIGNSIASLIPQIISVISIFILLVLILIWTWNICELRKRPGWWAIVTPVAFVIGVIFIAIEIEVITIIFLAAGFLWQFVMWGILGWSHKGEEQSYSENSHNIENSRNPIESKDVSEKMKQLSNFISQGKEKGYSGEELKKRVLEKGWSEKQFNKALDYSERI